MGKNTRLSQQSTSSVPVINIAITGTILNTITVRSYPDTDQTLYKIPLYEMIVSGIDHSGTVLSKSYEVLRFGIFTNYDLGIYERLIGLSTNQSYELIWRADIMDGVWQIEDDWLIIPGSTNTTEDIWGATGCIEVCGMNAWNNFIAFITQLAGCTDLNDLKTTQKIIFTCTAIPLPQIIKC